MTSENSVILNNTDWYLAVSKPRQEARAVENLKNQGINAYSPHVNVEKISAGKKRVVCEALFSGYVFINLSPDDGLWFKVKSTRGIRDWVRFTGKVAKLPTKLVNQLKQEKQENLDSLVLRKLVKGNPVRILSGPFEGLIGIFECPNGEQRSMILIEFLGKSNQLTFANEQITRD